MLIAWLQIASGLPKTRSGKIMRRILRKIAVGHTEVPQPDVANERQRPHFQDLGDTSTLADPSIVKELINSQIFSK